MFKVPEPSATAAAAEASPQLPAQRCELFRVLSEPLRLRLLALCAEEELSIGELAELLGESQPNVSRHAAPLKQVGLIVMRKQGTRTLLRTLGSDDAVVQDALLSGQAQCHSDGSLARVSEVIRARDALTREYFETARPEAQQAQPGELGAYLLALSVLLPRRTLAVDAGTGDGSLLDVLAPLFQRVVAIDRSAVQLEAARARVARRGYDHVQLIQGELASAEVLRAVRAQPDGATGGADVVFAARLLHHAPKPARLLAELMALCAPGGTLLLLDYAHHTDETMRERADLWLGFEERELRELTERAGFVASSIRIHAVPSSLHGTGPDRHLPWLILSATRPEQGHTSKPEQLARSKSEHEQMSESESSTLISANHNKPRKKSTSKGA